MSNTPSRDAILSENRRVHKEESAIYDALHHEIFNKAEQARLAADFDHLLEFRPRTALDVGAGTGNLTLRLLDHGLQVTALDIAPEMLERLQEKADAAGVGDRLTTHCMDFDAYLDGAPEPVDLVTFSSVLHHLPRPWDTLDRLAAWAKDRTVVYVTHEPTGRPANRAVRALRLADRAWMNLRQPRLRGRARRIDYSTSDYHAGPGIDPDRVAAVFAPHGFVASRLELYGAAGSALLSRIQTRLGAETDASIVLAPGPLGGTA